MPANAPKTTCIAFHSIKGLITFQTLLNVTKYNYCLNSKDTFNSCIWNMVWHNQNHFLNFITIDVYKVIRYDVNTLRGDFNFYI